MRLTVSDDVRALNPELTARHLKTARVKGAQGSAPDLEQELFDQILAAGLPVPMRQVPFAKVLRRDFVADFAWGEERIIVEVNGATFTKGAHSTGTGIHRDFIKQALANLLDFKYFEFDSKMIRDGDARIGEPSTAIRILLCAFGRENVFEADWKEKSGRWKVRK
jgi:hypothetical protein